MSTKYEATTDDEATSPPTAKAKTLPPDIIVAVGSGESMREFECYKAILYFASEYFQTMLISNMKEEAMGRIEFPDKNPEEWELFYEFISPKNIGAFSFDAKKMINEDNVMRLLPWFHEFRMAAHVEECDSCLAKVWKGWRRERHGIFAMWTKGQKDDESEDKHQARLAKRKAVFDEAVSMLEFASLYDLNLTQDSVGEGMSDLMDRLLGTDDLFDFRVITTLLQTVLPLGLDEASEKITCGGCKSLCQAFERLLSPHFSILQDILDKGGAMHCALPALVYSFRQTMLEKEKARVSLEDAERRLKKHQEDAQTRERKLKHSAQDIIHTIIEKYPDRIYEKLPEARSMKNCGTDGETIDSYGQRCLKQMLASHYREGKDDFDHLGIKKPSYYDYIQKNRWWYMR